MKSLYIVAGANGSGKTTFIANFNKTKGLTSLNADDIAKELTRDSRNSLSTKRIAAGKIFLKNIDACILKGESFIIETTLSGKYIKNIVAKAKKNGYGISIFYIFLGSERTNFQRIRSRVLKGGHDIPIPDVIRRRNRSRELFRKEYKYISRITGFYCIIGGLFGRNGRGFKSKSRECKL